MNLDFQNGANKEDKKSPLSSGSCVLELSKRALGEAFASSHNSCPLCKNIRVIKKYFEGVNEVAEYNVQVLDT